MTRGVARLILLRLAQAVPVLLAVAAIAFALSAVAGDPLAVLGPDATAAQRAQAAAWLGLNDPLALRYFRFVWHAAVGEFGFSTRAQRPVGALIAERLPASLQLAASAFALSLLVGLPAGVLAAWRRGGLAARTIMAASLLGVSLPTFLTGTLLMLVFSVALRWLPSSGRGGALSLVLPAATLALFQAALLLRLVRAGMLVALDSEMIRFVRARGLPRRSVLRHALGNALVPVVSAAAPQLGLLVAFAVVTESVFQWPGVGLLLVQSIASADVPVIAAYLVLTALLFVALNLVADLLCLALDPRLR